MNNYASAALAPSRILYPMIRVSDLDRSLTFYITVLDLTHNWDEGNYEHGTGYGHLVLEVADIFAACDRLARMGVRIARSPGPMKFAADESDAHETIAFVEDPDGYRIELIERT